MTGEDEHEFEKITFDVFLKKEQNLIKLEVIVIEKVKI